MLFHSLVLGFRRPGSVEPDPLQTKDSLVTNFVPSCLTLPVELAAVKVEAVGGVLVRTAAGIFTDQLHD